jgi:DNA primase
VPIRWEELTARLKPNQFTVENLQKRLDKLDTDPWAEMLSGDLANQTVPKMPAGGKQQGASRRR